jgi:hypothetical protein
MSQLPVRDLADAPIADAFAQPGCPLCRRVAVAEARFVDTMLYESVNDVAFRSELDGRRGFCARHTHGLLAENRRRTGSLSSAILLGAVLRVRRREVAAALQASGRGRARRVADAARRADCPICAQGRIALASAVESLQRLAGDATWSDAISRAAFCLEHLVGLGGASGTAGWEAILGRQVERLVALQERLDAFAHHSSEDRRHLLTDAERAAVDEAAAALGGEG